jgi:probable phosphoglycerate mutase
VRLILIRHGQTSSNTRRLLDTGYPGAPLDETGLTQAQALVDTLADEPIEVIMTSDLTRARQTAEPLAAARQLEPIAHQGLREIFAGDYEMSADWRPYVEIIQSWLTDPMTRVPGGESGVEFVSRYELALGELAAAGHECAAVVSHGAALRTWLTFRAANLPVGASERWAFANTATAVVEGGPGQWRVERWADQVIGGD